MKTEKQAMKQYMKEQLLDDYTCAVRMYEQSCYNVRECISDIKRGNTCATQDHLTEFEKRRELCFKNMQSIGDLLIKAMR